MRSYEDRIAALERKLAAMGATVLVLIGACIVIGIGALWCLVQILKYYG